MAQTRTIKQVYRESRLDKPLALVVTILMAIGTVMVFSASQNLTRVLDWRQFFQYAMLRQLLFFPLAIVVMYAASLIPYRSFSLDVGWKRSIAVWLLAFGILLLVLVLIPGVGIVRNNARRWLPLGGGLSFQPSEIAKWSAVFFMAAYTARYPDSMHLFRKRFLPVCMAILPIVGLILVEDVGTAAFIAVLAFLMLFIGGTRIWYLLSPVPVLAAGFVYVLIGSPNRLARITAFLNPDDPNVASGAGFQASQSLIALATGGLWGRGLGYGITKYGHLPEDATDFIFAIIGEEFGLVGTATVILLFMLFVYLGVLLIVRTQDPLGRMLATGIVLAVGIQAAFNIGVVTVMLPTKGIPLPFISAGGTSMLVSAAAVGILLNVAKETARQQ
ncbi:MAG TPA: putative lipid II flippase FtsW [Sedimentisphaerales bacterium]|nr:putative lipid II flippase FtsW [Sedimentisphaerales bacterium]